MQVCHSTEFNIVQSNRLVTGGKSYNKKLSYRRDSAQCGHSRSPLCQIANRRGIYDVLLALNSSLTRGFNRSSDTTPSLHILIRYG